MEVATAVGGAILSAVLPVLFHKLASKQVVDFFRGRDMKKEFKKLEKALRTINGFLNDAESKQYTNEAVKQWLDDLRDLAYEVEDVLDEVTTEEALRNNSSSSSSSSSTWGRFCGQSHLKPFQVTRHHRRCRHEIESSIKKITERFDELAQSKLGLVKIALGSSSISSSVSRETTSLVNESSIYGRKDDEQTIIELLRKEESSSTSHHTDQFSVIPIVGMGGVGKTTLAQLVYNSNWVQQNHYNLKAWVCVSDQFDINLITKTILVKLQLGAESVTSSPCQINDLDSLQIEVKMALTGKKFLIVLDDVWNNLSHPLHCGWDLLQKPFGVGAAGSAIIVTTRDRQVARIMGTVKPYDLELLSEDDCWRLFVQHAFGILSVDARPNLAIRKEIARKCKGLPLAAKLLGGLLRSKEEFEWENILNSKIWESKSGILPVLKLSYHYLPSHLKRCFSYCSIFPRDYEFHEEKLVQLWMAEGFLQHPNENMTLEGFGRKCFRELLSKSFFQPSSSRNYRFVMHDLMSDLALWAAGKTCFRLEDSCDMRDQSLARHLSCIYTKDNEVQKFEKLYGVESLRTFIQLDISWRIKSLTSDLLSKMKFVRVLSLPEPHITVLPSSIGDLKHLRYIDISYTGIESIPESVCTLYNLQTLLLNNCFNLTKLPEELRNLINLRHFDISTEWIKDVNEDERPGRIEAMPPQIGRLTSLRKLSDFVVGKDSGCGIEELANLKHLEGTLEISKLENVIDAELAKAANLSDKKGLDVLKIEWCSQFDNQRNERVETEVLDMLRPPHEKLKELRIICYGGASFPTWVGEATFSSMVVLELKDCEKCTHLPPLGQLPLLKHLSIRRMNGVVTAGPEFYGKGHSNPFPSLEKLSFEDMEEWTDWIPCAIEMRENLFALLQELTLKDCPNLLGSLPDHLPSLKRFEIKKCKALQSVSEAISGHNSSLEVLEIKDCPSLTSLFSSSSSSRGELPATLKRLEISYCPEMESLGERFHSNSSSLDLISIFSCGSLKCLPENLHSLTRLSQFDMSWCPSLVRFPDGGLPAANLRSLKFEGCEKLEALPNHMHDFTSLQSLTISNCPGIVSFFPQQQQEDSLPTSITKLHIGYPNICKKALFQWGLHRLSSLRELTVENGCSREQVFFPAEAETEGEEISMVFPSSLINLTICGFPNLESLTSKGFQNLTSLATLHIRSYPKLHSFPENGLPPSLLLLSIEYCTLLKERCKRDQGQEWSKISHVPLIKIDGNLISSRVQWSWGVGGGMNSAQTPAV